MQGTLGQGQGQGEGREMCRSGSHQLFAENFTESLTAAT